RSRWEDTESTTILSVRKVRSRGIDVKDIVLGVHREHLRGVPENAIASSGFALHFQEHAQIIGAAAVAADKDVCFCQRHVGGAAVRNVRRQGSWNARNRQEALRTREIWSRAAWTRERIKRGVVLPKRHQGAGWMNLR